jgi:hypothetical protein
LRRPEPLWEIRANADFRLNPANGDSTEPVKTALYVQVDPTGHASAGFRVPLWGGHITADIWGQDIFEDPALKKFRFRYEVDPYTIDIKPNVFSSRWENWEELLARNHLVAFSGSGTMDVTKDARAILQAKMQDDSSYGAAVRWNVQARPGDEVWAVLQALPKSASFLRRDGRYTEDDCAAIELGAFRLSTPINGDRPCRGPIPTLFSQT